jgi:hypothetical protein
MKITKGKQTRPQRVVIYGVESVGKTTFAAQFPTPLFLDIEGGTAHLETDRVEIQSWKELNTALKEVVNTDYQTVVIDSADWAERLCVEDLLFTTKKTSIEDFGYGKGWVQVAERMSRLLTALDSLIAIGKHVVLLAHSKVQRVEPPDLMTAYDRYELKMSKQSSPLVKEWADELWFFRFKTKVVESENGKAKGTGGKQRIILTTHSAAYDAKTRSGLAEELPMEWDSVAHLFATNATPRAKTEPAVGAGGRGGGGSWTLVSSDHVRAFEMLEANEDAVNTFLASNKSIQPGQTWRDVSEKLRANIVARPEALIAKALEAKEAA